MLSKCRLQARAKQVKGTSPTLARFSTELEVDRETCNAAIRVGPRCMEFAIIAFCKGTEDSNRHTLGYTQKSLFP
jgi:hypothetical protein